MHSIPDGVLYKLCTRIQIQYVRSSFEIFTNDLLIIEKTLMTDATALQQCRDGFRSLVNQPPDISLVTVTIIVITLLLQT